jgi:hypothetical protein
MDKTYNMTIQQLHFHKQFVEILKTLEYRNVSDWIVDNIEHGIRLSTCSHSVNVKNLMCLEDGWDGTFIVNDRYEHTSFVGFMVELAWVLSHTDEECRFIHPFLTRYDQNKRGLDFYIGEQTYQIKTATLMPGGALIVEKEYLETTANYLVLVDRDNAKSYTLSPADWSKLKRSAYQTNTGFWVDVFDIKQAGGEIRDLSNLSNFVTQAYPPRSSI